MYILLATCGPICRFLNPLIGALLEHSLGLHKNLTPPPSPQVGVLNPSKNKGALSAQLQRTLSFYLWGRTLEPWQAIWELLQDLPWQQQMPRTAPGPATVATDAESCSRPCCNSHRLLLHNQSYSQILLLPVSKPAWTCKGKGDGISLISFVGLYFCNRISLLCWQGVDKDSIEHLISTFKSLGYDDILKPQTVIRKKSKAVDKKEKSNRNSSQLALWVRFDLKVPFYQLIAVYAIGVALPLAEKGRELSYDNVLSPCTYTVPKGLLTPWGTSRDYSAIRQEGKGSPSPQFSLQ